MDHQHHQPIWPMLQGAFDYTLNLAGELWTMIWKPTEEPRVHSVMERSIESVQKEKGVMQGSASVPDSRIHQQRCASSKGERVT
jgi:hypothetical protein